MTARFQVSPSHWITLDDGEVIYGRQHLPLAGTVADVVEEEAGLFGRSAEISLVITAPDGRKIEHFVEHSTGPTVAWTANCERAADAINRAAGTTRKVRFRDKRAVPEEWLAKLRK